MLCSIGLVIYQNNLSYRAWIDRRLFDFKCKAGLRSAGFEPIGGEWVIVAWDMVEEWDGESEVMAGTVRARGEGGRGGEGGEEERRVRFTV